MQSEFLTIKSVVEVSPNLVGEPTHEYCVATRGRVAQVSQPGWQYKFEQASG